MVTSFSFQTNNGQYIESHQSRKLQLATVGWQQRNEDEGNYKLKNLLVSSS